MKGTYFGKRRSSSSMNDGNYLIYDLRETYPQLKLTFNVTLALLIFQIRTLNDMEHM